MERIGTGSKRQLVLSQAQRETSTRFTARDDAGQAASRRYEDSSKMPSSWSYDIATPIWLVE